MGRPDSESGYFKTTHLFCLPHLIRSQSDLIFVQLREERYLTGLDVISFSKRTAYHLSEINILHPFREGNGRTQREFIRCLGLKSGYVIDWAVADEKEFLEAMIDSAIRSEEKLAPIILSCIVSQKWLPTSPGSTPNYWQFLYVGLK
ncbi:Fic/DOC family protein [Paenactinomyces guangxiensis]|uniref:protein adenylyltransferase n=1 Tax=Paenactinomyces guangxiensis TaxID=1490290 RepID=A0A7W1WMQ2_9BACL|nr:Fic family protein [Paenactinomyces guangxiensis]MBH8590441.1 Fic family protein [Paenactinomyces guangxiensis]